MLESTKSTITLRSKDGVVFSVSKTVAKQSKFLHKIIENPGLITYLGKSITLPTITKSILENVIAYCTKHCIDAADVSKTETTEEGSSSMPANSRISVEELMKWDEQFVNGNAESLDDLNKVAEFLKIEGQQALLSRHIEEENKEEIKEKNEDEIEEGNEEESEEEIEEETEEEYELAEQRNKKIKFTDECTKEVRVVENKDKMEQVSELAAQSNTQKKYKGVRSRKWGRWSAVIGRGKSKHWPGTYDTVEEAAMAYDIARIFVKGYKVLPQLNFPVIVTTDASTESTITLRSKDGVVFSVSKTVAKQSRFLYKIMKNPRLITYFGNSITLPTITKSILENVIAYCTKHSAYAVDVSKTETTEEGSNSMPANSRISVEELMKWDEQFVNGNAASLDDLNKAAEFLEIEGLQALLSSKES